MKISIFDLPLFENFLKEKHSLSDSTVFVYVRSVERFLSENPDIENLDAYNNFIIKVSFKKRCPHYYSALKSFIEYKFGESAVKTKLVKGLIRPKERYDIVRERKHLNENQIFDVINQLDSPKHRIIALIQSLTGVRAGDIMRLKRGDNNSGILSELYNNKPVLRLNIIGKRRKRNVIFIHDKIAQELIMEYITNNINFNDYYFIELGKMKNRSGEHNEEHALIRMNYNWYWNDLKQALQTCGVNRQDFATHDFRRCFARRAWEKYKDIHVLQSLLNHADPKVTLRYLEQSGLKNVDYHYEMQQ